MLTTGNLDFDSNTRSQFLCLNESERRVKHFGGCFPVFFRPVSPGVGLPHRVHLAQLACGRAVRPPRLVGAWKDTLADGCPLPHVSNKRLRRNVSALPLRLSLGRSTLPWATIIVSQMAVAVGDRGHASACAKAVGTSTRRGVGTSVTVRTPNACAWSGAGRRHGARPGGARTRPPKPSMPRPSGRAAGVSTLCHNRRTSRTLRRRVVTQQKFFPRLRSARGPGAMTRP